jgi:hypothetical protein
MSTDYIWQNEIRRLNKDIDALRKDPDSYHLSGKGLDNLLELLLDSNINLEGAVSQMNDFLAKFPLKYRIIVARDLYRRTQGDRLHEAAAIACRNVTKS